MTRKERVFIEAKIDAYRRWAAEEAEKALRETDKDIKDELWLQARLNESAADTLALLLDELDEGRGRRWTNITHRP